jgi:hypothetical protein
MDKTEPKRDAVFESDTVVFTEDGFVQTYAMGTSPLSTEYLTTKELDDLVDGIDKMLAYRDKKGVQRG